MRLICPHCDAQYEVPPGVIPTGGRDVQCSNCGHTWYEPHPGDAVSAPAASAETAADPAVHRPSSATATEGEAGPRDLPTQAPGPRPDAAPDAGPGAAPDRSLAGRGGPTGVDPQSQTGTESGQDGGCDGEDAEHAAVSPPPPARRRSLDPDVADVLRAEAAFEARHRAAEAGSIETQGDLGLGGSAPQSARGRAHRAAISTGAVAPSRASGASASVPAKSRHEEAARTDASALPDVEEINRTLRASGDRSPVDTPHGRAVDAGARPVGGFGTGFLSVLAIAILLVGIYAFAPRIAATVPAAADPLAGYTAIVDQARGWLDMQVTSVLVWLDGLSSESADG